MNSSSTGLPSKLANFLAYFFGWISGLIFLFIEKSDSEVKFHAAQSVVFFGSCSILGIVLPLIPGLGPFVLQIIGALALVVWIVQLITSLVDKPLRLPVVSNFAAMLVTKV
jgi:uncharacterized membrane protein